MKIEMTVQQLESLLTEQKRLVAQQLLGQTYVYNLESTESNLKSLSVDKDKFMEVAMKTRSPEDVVVLKKYIKP